jgi:hypothetical protein
MPLDTNQVNSPRFQSQQTLDFGVMTEYGAYRPRRQSSSTGAADRDNQMTLFGRNSVGAGCHDSDTCAEPLFPALDLNPVEITSLTTNPYAQEDGWYWHSPHDWLSDVESDTQGDIQGEGCIEYGPYATFAQAQLAKEQYLLQEAQIQKSMKQAAKKAPTPKKPSKSDPSKDALNKARKSA